MIKKIPVSGKSHDNAVYIIGDHLYIVAGAKRWCLYDLSKETLTTIDNDSALALKESSLILGSSPHDKRLHLQEEYPLVWDCAKDVGIIDRLFEQETSKLPATIPMDIMWIEITDKCNERCIQCYDESSPERDTVMSYSLAKNIIRQGSVYNFAKLQITGGEPFMHDRISDILRYACGYAYPTVEVFTNLTLLSDKDLAMIHSLGIKIATTLLGPNAMVHDACTRTPGSFQRWYTNIKKVQSLGINFRIGVIRMKQNESVMSDIEKFLKDEMLLGPDDKFNPDNIRPAGRGRNMSAQPLGKYDYEPNLKAHSKFFHLARNYNPCWRGELSVSTDGTVHPCVFSKEITAGNLARESLSVVIKRLTKHYWSITLDHVDRCKDCELRYACMDCRGLCLNSGLGLFGSQPRCNYDPYSED